MITRKITLGALFFLVSNSAIVWAQEKPKKDSEKDIEGVSIKAVRDKKTETAILQDQKKAIIQKQSIGAEEISRKAISNVEQGLTKVTGITAVEGKGLFVRGLEERYNTLLVNGLATPSNNPFQKIIALKQFPTDVVGKLNIFKTFNSNLYADFAGATFDIETLSYERAFTKIEFSIGVNTQNTFRNDFRINPNANSIEGYVGLNSKKRALPAEVNGFRPSSYQFNTTQSLQSFKEGWDVEKITSLPNTSLSFTTAQRFKLGDTTNLGVLLSLNQGSSYKYKEGANNAFRLNGNQIDYNNKLYKKEYDYDVESSAILGLGLKNKGTTVNFNAIFLQNSENTIENQRGFRDGGQTAPDQFFSVNQQDISRFTNLQLLASQKLGERHLLKAGGSWVNNFFSQPDRKIFYGIPTAKENEILLSFGGNNLLRQYLDVQGKNYFSAMAEYTVSLGNKGDRNDYPVLLTLGYNGFRDIRNTSYRFIYSFNNSNNTFLVNTDKLQAVFNQALQNSEYGYKEGSTSEYRSNIYQFVNAGYLNLNYKPTDNWDILVGGRVENNKNITRYKPIRIGVNDPFINLVKDQYYFLPSVSIKYALDSKSNIRFAASKTITRPILVEYMPITYQNPDNKNIYGNINLNNSQNYNVDLKYEVFPTNRELFSANLFAKRIQDAIETSFTASGNSNGQTITFFNAKHATVAGIELEGILALRRLSESLDKFTLGANATVMHSDVERSAEQKGETDAEANRKRALQGASPWILNADLKYELKKSNDQNHTVSLVYNVSGKKIYGVGFAKMDNVYELPFHQLDLVYNAQINQNWNIKLGVLNLLNSEYRLTMGDRSLVKVDANSLIMENYKKGTNFNVSVGYKF